MSSVSLQNIMTRMTTMNCLCRNELIFSLICFNIDRILMDNFLHLVKVKKSIGFCKIAFLNYHPSTPLRRPQEVPVGMTLRLSR